MLGPMNGSAKTTAPSAYRPANRLSTLQKGPPRSSSLSLSSQNSAGSNHRSPSDDPGLLSPSSSDVQGQRSRSGLSPALSRTSVISQGITSPSISSPRSVASSGVAQALSGQAPLSNTAVTKEVEDLKVKLRVMEKKRLEDREKIKTLDKIQGERDRFEVIIQKLQSKYQPQQQEISDLRRQIKEAESKLKTSENQQVDIDAAIEMATLDREMAEETAEAVKSELEALRVKYEELELEVEILREENAELGKEMTPEEKTSQGWIQMERNNDRLREALLRLRDMTQEQEAALRQQIKELESDVQELEKVRASYQEVKEKLAQSDAAVDNLRQQLETALGAEEMIEELTEKNFFLTEKMDELKAAIEDLENLKELNDELEINHIETEKQMQNEIDYMEILLQDQIRKSSTQEETIGDLEYTISRFRDLVTTLQGDLEDMRASQQITEIEANELSSRSRAMLDLNRRLQVSATKAQVKAIDIELGKMQAEESAEHLAIVQLFLPDTFTTERESVNALLRFKRIGFKASLLCGLVKERMNNPSIPGREENTFACLDVLDKLTWISTICERFTQFIYTSSLESFERLGSALYDLDPVERALNSWIDGMKRDELKEQQCAAELQRYPLY
jgi:dynactin 1